MTGRLTVAAELTEIITSLQGMLERGARLAEASGGMVSPMYFRGALTSMTLAAGELDQKGLLVKPAETPSGAA
jgi:hypothetical protein